MTSDHQAISTMHTPLPKQQQVSAKDLHKVCNELGVLSMADGDCEQCLSSDRHSQLNAQEGENGQSSATSVASEQHLSSMNGTTLAGNGDENEDDETTARAAAARAENGDACLNDGYAAVATSRQDSEMSVDTCNSGERSANGQLLVQVDHISSSSANCPITDQSMLSPSPTDCVGTVDGQIVNGLPIAIHSDSSGVHSAHWPGYDMSFEDLKTRVRHQLEYYFSRENLAADAYLRSQMDNDQFVKVAILANFNMVKRLTTDLNLVLQALRESPCLQLDDSGEKVRPIHKRCTLILREIPEDTTQKEVEDLFASPMCPKIISCEYALNNIWYVNFDTDEDAQKAFLYLRQQVQNFKGKPILARIKTAPIPRVQNGYRPVPPNSLPLQTPQQGTPANASVATPNSVPTLLSPAADAVTLPLSFPPSAVCTPVAANGVVGAATPGDGSAGCVVVCSNSVTLPGSAGIAAMPPSNIYYYSTGAGQTAIMAAAGHASAVVGPAAAAVLSPTWPSAGPASFDLGYILAVNGYQPQGAYRPALLVPAAPIPAQVAAAVGHRFVTDRPPRKTRSSGSYYSAHAGDRNTPNSAENGRPALVSSYNRFGSSTSSRTSGNYGDGRPPYYRNEQNIHYNNIRNRPNRPSANGNTSNGVGPRRYQQPRSERYAGADYWSSSTSLAKDRKAATTASATAAATPANGAPTSGSVEGKRSDGFDLQSSSFPPLPTTNSEQGETLASSAPPEPSPAVARSPSQTAAAQIQQGPQRVDNSHKEQTTGHNNPVSSSTAKVRPRVMQQSTVENVNGFDHSKLSSESPPSTHEQHAPTGAISEDEKKPIDCPTSRINKNSESAKVTSAFNESQFRDQKLMHKNISSATTTTGGVIRGGTNMTIPVAVVVPNAQPKVPRVPTADKATVTDSPSHISKMEERSNSVATMTSHSPKLNDGLSAEDKASNDYAKRLSYAEMAKQAAARNAAFAAVAAAASAEKSLSATTSTVGTSTTVSAPGNGKDLRTNNEDGGRRWASRGGAGGAAGPNGQSQGRYNTHPRESSHKYNSRKQRPYRNRDYQQEQEHASPQNQAVSPPPSTS